MTLDELRRLEQAATAGPWQEFAESGDWWIAGVDADGGPLGSVCNSDVGDRGAWARQADIELVVAARNALPALLRVAEALRRYDRARKAQQALIVSWEARGESVVGQEWTEALQTQLQQEAEADARAMDPLTDEEVAAWDELFAALAALEAQP